MPTYKSFNSVNFIKSISDLANAPIPRRVEIAFAGRSNVGKSSLLNAVFKRKNLVKTSSTPGKTQLLNYFNINDEFYCVDLPGYGYAKLPMSLKKKWQAMIEKYVLENSHLTQIYLLIDSRHDIMANDLQMIEWLKSTGKNFTIVLSKFDKLKKSQYQTQLDYFSKVVDTQTVMPFSIKSGIFVNDLKTHIIKSLS